VAKQIASEAEREASPKFGLVAVLGKPNVGKSTIVNALVGQKVSIVSPKPQTTRRRVLGIANGPGYQIGLVDTPGIHDAHTRLGKAMVDSARQALGDVDAVLIVVDASKPPDELDQRLAEQLARSAPASRSSHEVSPLPSGGRPVSGSEAGGDLPAGSSSQEASPLPTGGRPVSGSEPGGGLPAGSSSQEASPLPSGGRPVSGSEPGGGPQAPGHRLPRILCLNKMDRLKPEFVLPHVEAYTKLFQTEESMLTDALRQENLDKLLQMVLAHLPEGEPRFGEDDFTDQSARFLAAELIRERVLLETRQEVPHATAVRIDEWEEKEGLTRILASVVVEKPGQRAILIGKGGQFLKKLGSEARREIEELLGTKVYLELHVIARENWRMNPRMLAEMEYGE
jgi:GTPase